MLTDERLASALGLKLSKVYGETNRMANARDHSPRGHERLDIEYEESPAPARRTRSVIQEEDLGIEERDDGRRFGWRPPPSNMAVMSAPAAKVSSPVLMHFGGLSYVIILLLLAASIFGLEVYRIRQVSWLDTRVEHLDSEVESMRNHVQHALKISGTVPVDEKVVVSVMQDKKEVEMSHGLVDLRPRSKRGVGGDRMKRNPTNEDGCCARRRMQMRQLANKLSNDPGPVLLLDGTTSLGSGNTFAWRAPPLSNISDEYVITSGKLVVRKLGTFFLYVQVFYTAAGSSSSSSSSSSDFSRGSGGSSYVSGYNVLLNGRVVARCARSNRAIQFSRNPFTRACFAAKSLFLRPSDELRIQALQPFRGNVDADENNSFLGFFRVRQ